MVDWLTKIYELESMATHKKIFPKFTISGSDCAHDQNQRGTLWLLTQRKLTRYSALTHQQNSNCFCMIFSFAEIK